MSKKDLLSGVEQTLYIPLAARIYASEKFPNFFYDHQALSLKPYLSIDKIKNNSNEYFYMASVCRQHSIDQKIKKFLQKQSRSNVVFLGAGLETAYHRLNNSQANFYQLDLPKVIKIRKELLGSGKNEKLIAADMFSLDWTTQINTLLPTLLVVAGVFQYFPKDKIVTLIKKIKTLFPQGELIFDATNSQGLKIANQYVKKAGNDNAQMHFALDNPPEFAHLTDTKLIDVSGFFAAALKNCHNLKLITKIFMYFADKLHRTIIVHLQLN